jgi:F-type H+-transporting ATPase subunit b
LKTIDAQARQRIMEGVAEGQKVAGEIRTQAQAEGAARLERAADEILREREKAKEVLKEQVISLSLRTAEKILRQKLDDPAQRKLASEFIDEVGALR